MRPDIIPGGVFPDYALPDPGRTVQQDLDIAEYTDPENNPMIPHTLVLKPGLVVHTGDRSPFHGWDRQPSPAGGSTSS
ncbi:MAG TPA: hypothetical protein VFV73_27785 [Streptosporangiaceae bacterium]|nr:hypothetical protein [Streptosporangiaceae bacterium]